MTRPLESKAMNSDPQQHDPGTQTDLPALTWPAQRRGADSNEHIQKRVVLEEPLEITINGQSVAVLMRMPGQEKELAVGFCLGEGYIRDVRDILLLHHCGLGHPSPVEEDDGDLESRNRVEIRASEQGLTLPDRPDVIRLIRSGCGAADVSALCSDLPTVSSELTVPASTVLVLGRRMCALQIVHTEIGGAHAAAVFQEAEPVVVSEDIGRHNAVDKAIGFCALRGIALHDKLLVTSGRASYEMVVKAVRAGIPIAATISAPTSLAVQLAHDRGVTLVGYLRGGRMTVYTHPERIVQDLPLKSSDLPE